jgi:hypothetical protein
MNCQKSEKRIKTPELPHHSLDTNGSHIKYQLCLRSGMLGGSLTPLLPRATVRNASSPQESTCSEDAVMCPGASTYASGCSRQRSGYGSQCCAVRWYYGDIASCTRRKTRLQDNRSKGLVVGQPSFRWFMPGLLPRLESISIAPIQEQRMLLAVTFTLPASCSPTARTNCCNSIEQDSG